MTVHSLSTGEESEEVFPMAGQDNTPSLVNQAKAQGWPAGIFNFGKAEEGDVAHFNPSLVEKPDGLWLIVRRAVFNGTDRFGHNSLYAAKLKEHDDGTLQPEFMDPIRFLDAKDQEHFEDPRCVYNPGADQVVIGACNFLWFGDGNWTGAHQVLGVFDKDWNCLRRYDPQIGGNPDQVDHKGNKNEKNWVWWFHDGRLTVLYHSNPWRIAQFGQSWTDAIPHEIDPGVTWAHGEIRGGTPPVLAAAPQPAAVCSAPQEQPDATSRSCLWTFFHSSVPWIGRFRRYHMGAIGFEAKPPFRPLYITPEPILTGSQNDPWGPKKPLVVFPCGALLRSVADGQNPEWLVTYGVNDLKCGYVKIPHADILKLVVPISGVEAAVSAAEPATIRENSCPFVVEFPTLGDQIRHHVDALVTLENNQASRKARILSELRKRKLAPAPRPAKSRGAALRD